MYRYKILILDVGLVCLATLLSLALRDNFDLTWDHLIAFVPYMTATTMFAACIFVAIGLDRAVWRFSGRNDYLRLIASSFAIVASAAIAAFVYNRLEGVARSLPILQFLSCVVILIGARALHKISHDLRRQRKALPVFLQLPESRHQSNILIVGVSRLTKVYLQAVDEFASGRIRIAGLLGHTNRHVGRLVATHPVIGVPSEIDRILNSLNVHGVSIDQIVIASSFQSLPAADREALLDVERSRGIPLRFLAGELGLLGVWEAKFSLKSDGKDQCVTAPELSFQIQSSELESLAKRRYWIFKRIADFIGALLLLIAAAPFMAIAALLTALSIGSPVLFWQQRPGLGGRPFRLYKFRTMRAGHASDGRRLSDAERVSHIGNLMRRVRLDELPQLVNILRGDMCFIGPRPLLPCDQSDAYRARLLVRPGLTGWAQVVGGRDISPEDKAALDIWYVRNASFLLDLQIFARTAFMLIFGERISRRLIEKAWCDLSRGGILRGDLALRTRNAVPMNSSNA